MDLHKNIQTMQPEFNLATLFKQCPIRLKNILLPYLHQVPALDLKMALEYTLSNSGKQLRPLLVYATGITFNAPWENMDVAAAAIELIHTYSLIHDDLPCMDNADLRRHQPTCHKVYGEAMAVLTGDALQPLAMQIIAAHDAPLSATQRIQMVAALSEASGPFGMVSGQALDMTYLTKVSISETLLLDTYRLKTGALLSCAIALGLISANCQDEQHELALKNFGNAIGLAFQVQDDLLDIETSSQHSGKSSGIDADQHKFTFPARHGVKAAKNKVETLYQEALAALDYLGHRAQLLRELAQFMLFRKN